MFFFCFVLSFGRVTGTSPLSTWTCTLCFFLSLTCFTRMTVTAGDIGPRIKMSLTRLVSCYEQSTDILSHEKIKHRNSIFVGIAFNHDRSTGLLFWL